MKYAETTNVSSESSRAEIERTLRRYGADQFMSGWETGRAVIAFRIKSLHVRFILTMPDIEKFRRTPEKRLLRSQADTEKAWEQACRQRWRALALVIKAKLEAVECGITTIENEFMAHVVLPDNRTVGEAIMPEIEQAYQTGQMPSSLLALPEPDKKQ